MWDGLRVGRRAAPTSLHCTGRGQAGDHRGETRPRIIIIIPTIRRRFSAILTGCAIEVKSLVYISIVDLIQFNSQETE